MGSSHVHALVDLVSHSHSHSMFRQGMLGSRHRPFRPKISAKDCPVPQWDVGCAFATDRTSAPLFWVCGRPLRLCRSISTNASSWSPAFLWARSPLEKGFDHRPPCENRGQFAPGRLAVISCGGGRSHSWCAPRWALVTAQSAPRCGAQHRVRPTPLGAQCLPDLLMSALCSVRSEGP